MGMCFMPKLKVVVPKGMCVLEQDFSDTYGHVFHAIVLGGDGETPSCSSDQQDRSLFSGERVLRIMMICSGEEKQNQLFLYHDHVKNGRNDNLNDDHLPSVNNDRNSRDGDAQTTIDGNVKRANTVNLGRIDGGNGILKISHQFDENIADTKEKRCRCDEEKSKA